jgi:hypothetical protein
MPVLACHFPRPCYKKFNSGQLIILIRGQEGSAASFLSWSATAGASGRAHDFSHPAAARYVWPSSGLEKLIQKPQLIIEPGGEKSGITLEIFLAAGFLMTKKR